MKRFDPRAALRKIENGDLTPANPANPANLEPSHGARLAELAELAAPEREIAKIDDAPDAHGSNEFRYGFTFTGRPKTWTGKIVSLDEWRRLSAWDRHGPDGRVWNGKTRAWEEPQS